MFQPFDEVVCVDDAGIARGYGDEARPVRGRHYTVRETSDGDRILLVEVVNLVRPYTRDGRTVVEEPAWFARRFLPVRRESVEIFHKMCVSNRPLIEVD